MCQIELVNMKIYKYNKSSNYTIYKPTCSDASEYKIIIKTTEPIFLQFNLFVKFCEQINISGPNSLINYDIFPSNGIIYSNTLDKNTHTNSFNQIIISIRPLEMCGKIIIKSLLETKINKTKLINIKWDNIFIINLLRRSERKNSMIKKLEKENISKYQFIEAFDGLDPEINSKYMEIKKINNNYICTPGHFGCLLSHIKAIRLAKKCNYEYIMILEDDIYFNENFIDQIKCLTVPEFDMLYLGGIMSKQKKFLNNWAFANGNRILGAYGYILSSGIFDMILNGLEKFNEYVDIFYIKNIQLTKSIIILNDFVKTNLDSSDTSHKSKTMVKRLEYIK